MVRTLQNQEGVMGHFARLRLIGKVTYYLGWTALISGGLVHFDVARTLFIGLSVNKRNLFELSVMCFLICIASELRVLAAGGSEVSSKTLPTVKKQAAA
jgi:hypothetical protein